MMKKTTRSIKRHLALPVCCGALALCLTAGAGAVSQADVQLRPDMTILIDGKEQTFYNAEGQEVQPILCDGTTYLPVRAVASALGLDVEWIQETSTIALSLPEAEQPIFITKTGKKYHYDDHSNGATYWEAPLATALGFGLETCDKCVLKSN